MKLRLMRLEERIVLEAAGAITVDAVDHLSDQAQEFLDVQHAADQLPDQPDTGQDHAAVTEADNDSAQRREIVFVDPIINNYQILVDEISREREVIVLDPSGGIDQISEILSQLSDIDAVHIFSHGSEGRIVFTSETLSSENINSYADSLASWANALTPEADILFYGCNVAGNETGDALISRIAELTGADVAASTDDTGANDLGGDWQLEKESGQIEAATLGVVDYQNVLGTPVISNLDSKAYTEDDGAVIIDNDVSLSGGTSYSGGYIEFELTNGQAEDFLALTTDGSASSVNEQLSIVGDTVYIGNGTTAIVFGSVDPTFDGQNGQKLRINFSNEFENGDFSIGTDGSTTISGWTAVNQQVKFGTNTIAGLPTPTDTVWPTNWTGPYTDQNTPTNLGTLQTVLSSIQNDGSGLSVKLSSTGMTTLAGYDIVRGPYIYSNGTVSLSVNDTVSFEWQAQGGGDAYDVYGYIVDVGTGHIETILNETGSSTAASTVWATKAVTVSQAGQYRFVFVSGTYDYSGGRAAGAQLFIDDVTVTQAVPPPTVTDAHVTDIARRVTYENNSQAPDTTARIFKITALSATSNTGTASTTITITSVDDPPVLTISGGNSSFTEDGGAITVDGTLTITDVDGGNIDGARVSITSGLDTVDDVLSFTPQSGITGSYSSSTGILSLSGSASVSAYQSALRSVTYNNTDSQNPDTTSRVISFSLGSAVSFSGNGHFYEFVSAPAISWTASDAAADVSRYYGLQGYLVTVTSAAENTFVNSKLAGEGWMGASDATVEGTWKWETGPEAGQQFWSGLSNGSVVGGMYNNWAASEPNNLGNEDYAHFLVGGQWNDYPLSLGGIAGYVVEYGGMPGDPVLQISGSRTVTVTRVNDSPTFSGGVTLTAVNEDSTPAGSTVSALLSSSFGDVDIGNAFAGIAISANTANSSTEGKWQYTTDGSNWYDISSVSTSSALLLSTAAKLRFLPAAHFNGTPTGITVYAVDDSSATTWTSGASRQIFNTTTDNNTSKVAAAGVSVGTSITAVNDAPVNTIPAGQSVNEDATLTFSSGNSNQISVSDTIDTTQTGATDALSSTVSVAHGTLTAVTGGGAGIANNGTASVTISGTRAQINAALNGLQYTPANHFNNNNGGAAETLTIVTSDSGNTGGGNLADSDTVAITVNAVNDAPINTVPGVQTVNEDATLTFSAGNSNQISVSDSIDTDETGATDSLSATVSVLHGTLTAVTGTGATVTNNGTALVTISGTRTQINNALNGLQYTPTLHFNNNLGGAAETLTIATSDSGNTGGPGNLSDSDTVSITVNAVNDAPTNTVPGAQSVNEDATLVFSAGNSNQVSVTDAPDTNETGATDALSSTVSVAHGTLTAVTGGGAAISNNGTASVTISGTRAQINAALNGLSYTPTLHFNNNLGGAAETLTIVTSDSGNTGSGGTLTDTDTVSITVNAVNDAPINTVPGARSLNEDGSLVFSGNISVSDGNDTGQVGATDGLTSTISVTKGLLTVTGGSGAAVSNDGTTTVTISGTAAQINAALNGLVYEPIANYNGADTLTILTNDNGNTGIGTALADSDTVAITVNGVNDAPINLGQQEIFDNFNNNSLDGSKWQVVEGVRGDVDWVVEQNFRLEMQNRDFLVTRDQFDPSQTDILHVMGRLSFDQNDESVKIVTRSDGVSAGAYGEVQSGIWFYMDAPSNTIGFNSSGGATVTGISGDNSITLSVGGHYDFELTDDGTNLTFSVTDVSNSGNTVSVTGTSTFNPGTNYVTFYNRENTGVNHQAYFDDILIETMTGAQTMFEDTILRFNTANGNTLTVTDFLDTAQGGATDSLTTTVTVTQGNLNTAKNSGATITSNGTPSVTIAGTEAQVNAALNGLVYKPYPNYYGNETLTMVTSDVGNTGGGALTDTETVAITILPVNDAPTMTTQGLNVNLTSHDITTTAQGVLTSNPVDMDGDGDMDIVSSAGSQNEISWYENDGSENFIIHVISNSATHPSDVYAVDVDQDGDIDVFSASWNDNTIAWYENDGSENFTSHVINSSASGASAVDVADVDGDAYNDVISSSYKDNTIAWYENDGNENFTKVIISSTMANPSSVMAIDMDGDDDTDILATAFGSNSVYWFENDGDENFTRRTITSSAAGAQSAFAIDVDSDGDIDVVSASANNDTIAWYENNGSENFTGHTISTTADRAYSVYAADMDNDGDVDIFSASWNDHRISWYENDGFEHFTTHTVTSTAMNASSVIAVNLDGDSDIDILSTSWDDDRISWHENLVSTAVNEDTALVFSSGNGNQIAVDDIDLEANAIKITLTATNATLTLATLDNLTFSANDGTADTTMTFTGTLAAVNTALNGLSLLPDTDYNGPASLRIVADDQGYTGQGNVLTVDQTIAITVNPVNDAPVNSVPGGQTLNEDSSVTFNTANSNTLTVTDSTDTGVAGATDHLTSTVSVGSGTLTVAGGSGATVSNNGTAAVTISGTTAQVDAALNGMIYTPNQHFSGSDTLSLATSDGGNTGSGGSLSDTDTVTLTVTPDADAPTVTVTAAASGNEDGAISLAIAAALLDTDGSETLSDITITGVPAGATLSAGTDNGGGSWTVTTAQLNGLTITPPANDDAEFTLTIAATATETANSDTATTTKTINVTVNPVADAPTLTVTSTASGNEDSAIALAITAPALTDTDGSETLSDITITGVPAGASLSAGTDNGGGSWTVTAAQLAGLTVTPPSHDADPFILTISATSTEGGNSDTASIAKTISVTVTPVADTPTLTVTSTATGNEDSAIALAITAPSLEDTDGSETLSDIAITGVPTGAVLSAGTDNGGGSWTVTAAQLNGLTVIPKANDNTNFTLTVAVAATEGANSDSAAVSKTIDVTVNPVNDAPANTVVPSISGTPAVGQVVTANAGTWNDAVDTDVSGTSTITYTYQWQRADSSSGANTVDISGAIGSTYTLTGSDAHKYIRLKVTGTDDGVGSPATMSSTAMSGFVAVGNSAPVISQGDSVAQTMSEDSAPTGWSSPTVSATDADGDSLTWSLNANASMGTAAVSGTGATPTFTYKPGANFNGSDSFQLRVTDSYGATDTITVNVTVEAVNDPLVNTVAPGVSGSFVVGGTLSASAGSWNDAVDTNVSGSSTITYAYQWQRADNSSGTNLADISGANDSTYVLTGADAHKYIRIKVTAQDDGVGTPASNTVVAVSGYSSVNNDAPVITQGATVSQTMSEDGAPTAWSTPTITATDADGDTLTWSLNSGAAAGTATVSGTGVAPTITYTPGANFNGSDSFVVKVQDNNGALDTVSVHVTVEAVNDALVNTAVPVVTGSRVVGETLSAAAGSWNDVIDTNVSGASTITYAYQWQRAADSSGTALENISGATGTTYVLTAADAHKYVRVQVTGSDDGVGDPSSQSLTVFSTYSVITNTAPVISQGTSVAQTMSEDGDPTGWSAPVITATDADGDTLTWSLVANPTKGTASVSGTGASPTITYVPAANYNGSDSFTLTVVDGKGGADNITVNVTVSPVNDAPVNSALPVVSGTMAVGGTLAVTNGTWSDATDTSVSGTSDFTYTYQWQRADDASGTNLENISGATGATYALAAADAHKYVRVTVTAHDDGVGDPAGHSVAAVSAYKAVANSAPVIDQGSSVTRTMTEDGSPTSWSVPVISAADADGDTLTWSLAGPATHGSASVSGTGGSPDSILYTPNANFNGSDSFIIKVTDGQGSSDTITINVTVDPVNDAPVNTALPGFSGTMEVGRTLYANSGSWSDQIDTGTANAANISYGYQWQRADDAAGTNVADISGATGSSYVLTAADAHKYIRLMVTATDSGVGLPATLSTVAYSAYDGVDNTAPVIAQGILINQAMSEDASPIVWSAPTLSATDVDGDGLSWSLVSGATYGSATVSGAGGSPDSITYTPNANYNGTDSFVIQVADGKGGTDTITVQVNIAAMNDAPVNTAAPAITGTVVVGNVVSAATGTWNDALDTDVRGASTLSYTYQWQRADDSFNTNLEDIAGATRETYRVTAADAHKFLRLKVTASDTGVGSPSSQSTAALSDYTFVSNTDPVIVQGDSVSRTIVEDSTAQEWTTPTITASDTDGDTLTWMLSSNAAHGTATVVGTGASPVITYTPNADFNGQDSFQARVADGSGGIDTITIAVTITAVNDAPVNTGDPGVTGTQAVGETLTAVPGTWNDAADTDVSGSSSIIYGYQWQRADDSSGTNLVNIAGATGSSYTVTSGDAHKYIRVKVTGMDTGVGTPVSQMTAAYSSYGLIGNMAPVIAQGDAVSQVISEDSATVSWSTPIITASDVDSDTLTWSLSSDGSNGAATVSGTGSTPTITYAPDADFNGSDSFVAMVTDGKGGTDTVTVNVTVTPVNDAPVNTAAPIFSGTLLVGESLTAGDGTWSDAIDTDVSGSSTFSYAYQWQRADDAGGTNVANISGATDAVYVLTEADAHKYVRVNVVTRDNGVGSPANLTVSEVSGFGLVANTAPVIGQGDTATAAISEDGSPTAWAAPTIAATDVDGDSLTWSLKTAAGHGVATVGGTGSVPTVNYTPAANFNGSDSFEITVADGSGATDTITVNVTVTPINDAPVNTAGPDISGTLLVGEILTAGSGVWNDAIDTDVSGASSFIYTYQWQRADDASGTNLADINNATAATYTLTGSDAHKYVTVVVTATDDGVGTPASRAVSVPAGFVGIANTAPVITQGDSTGQSMSEDSEGTSWSIPAIAAMDADGDSLTWSLKTAAGNGTAAVSGSGPTPTVSYAPNSNFSGSDSFAIQVDDGQGGSDTITVNVTVAPVADIPTLTLTDTASGNEDTAIALDISAPVPGDTDGSETLSDVTVGNVPSGAVLSAGTDNGNGTWTLAAADLQNLTITPALHDDSDFTLAVSVTGTEGANGDSETVLKNIAVTVDAVVDVPTWDVTSAASGNEDSAIALAISAPVLVDGDGSETLSDITIANVPTGAVLSAGTDNGNGTWALTAADLTDLTITPALHDADDFTLTVSVTATEGANGDAVEISREIAVSITPVADAPVLTLTDTAAGNEDTAIPVIIDAPSLVDSDGSETLSAITFANVPAGAVLSAGTDNGDGTWTLTAGELPNLTITPALNDDSDFQLNVSVTATEGENGHALSVTETLDVVVDAVADAPVLTLTDTASGNEDTAIPLAISIPSLVDTDGSETLSDITIANVPTGAVLSAGSDNGNGSWTLAAGELTNLTITPAAHDADDFTLDLSVTATETSNGSTATATGSIAVAVTPVADAPTLDLIGTASGNEDTEISLTINAPALVDTDGSETLSDITIGNVPVGAMLSAGSDNGNGTWTLTAGDLAGLTVTPALHDDSDFTLTVFVQATEGETSLSAATAGDITVTFNGVADTPAMEVSSTASGNEDTAIALDISAPVPGDTDGSETLSDVTVGNVPTGAVLSAGTDNGNGIWTLTAADLQNLTITPALHDDSEFTLAVSVTATEGANGDSETVLKNIAVTVDAVVDVPTWDVTSAAGGNEDSAIALAISAPVLVDGDGSETLSDITIANVPTGAVLSAGTDNGNGTWALTAADLTDLTITPALHDADDFTLTVSVTATEGANGDAVEISREIAVSITPVADAPVLTLTDTAVGNEDTAISLTIDALSLVDSDGSETLSAITIVNVPAGAVLSAGSDNGDGSWTLTSGELSNLTITPALNDDSDFQLEVSVTATEGENGHAITVTETLDVAVDAVADTPTVSLTGTAGGNEDTAIPLTFNAPSLVDTDGSETLSAITIANVPTGAVLSAGTNNGNGTWTLTAAQLPGLTITPALNDDADFTLAVSATASEGSNNDSQTTTASITVTVNAVADGPAINLTAAVTGNEDSAIGLAITAPALVDTDGSEILSNITIANVPAGAVLSAGTNNGNGTWTLTAAQLSSLTITPPADDNRVMTLTISASTTEISNNSSATHSDTITIATTAVNDAPDFTKGVNQTVNADGGAKTIVGWARNISTGPGDEAGQIPRFTVTNTNNALFVSQPAISANGTLTYAPNIDAFGTATVTVVLSDNGGTANGGVNTGPAKTFLITVNPKTPPPQEQGVETPQSPVLTGGDGTNIVDVIIPDSQNPEPGYDPSPDPTGDILPTSTSGPVEVAEAGYTGEDGTGSTIVVATTPITVPDADASLPPAGIVLPVTTSGTTTPPSGVPGGVPTGGVPAAEAPTGAVPAAETAAGEGPAAETPTGGVPAVEAAAGDVPATEAAAETPAGEAPADLDQAPKDGQSSEGTPDSTAAAPATDPVSEPDGTRAGGGAGESSGIDDSLQVDTDQGSYEGSVRSLLVETIIDRMTVYSESAATVPENISSAITTEVQQARQQDATLTNISPEAAFAAKQLIAEAIDIMDYEPAQKDTMKAINTRVIDLMLSGTATRADMVDTVNAVNDLAMLQNMLGTDQASARYGKMFNLWLKSLNKTVLKLGTSGFDVSELMKTLKELEKNIN